MTETELFAPAPPPASPARVLTAAEFRGLAGLPEPLRQRVMANWPALLERREAAERALLLAGKPAGVAELVKQGMLPL